MCFVGENDGDSGHWLYQERENCVLGSSGAFAKNKNGVNDLMPRAGGLFCLEMGKIHNSTAVTSTARIHAPSLLFHFSLSIKKLNHGQKIQKQ
jgi:hypothetical protein